MKTARWVSAITAAAVLMCGFAIFPVASEALTVQFDTPLTGIAKPAGVGDPGWLTATFDNVTGGVQLRLQANLQDSNEFISKVYFNIDPLLSLSSSEISFVPVDAPATFDENKLKADGDGWYDILFTFPNTGAGRFDGTETLVYNIICPGCSSSSFNFLSLPGGGNGVYTAAAHIQGVQGTQGPSAWVGGFGVATAPVPEPGSLLVMGFGLVAVGIWGRKQLAKEQK